MVYDLFFSILVKHMGYGSWSSSNRYTNIISNTISK